MSEEKKVYRVYTIVERPRQDPFWLNIGSAFKHEKGDGWNVLLQALPLPNRDGTVKLVIREWEPKGDDTKTGGKKDD